MTKHAVAAYIHQTLQWRWIGHTLKRKYHPPSTRLEPPGKRKVSRQKHFWMRTMENEARAAQLKSAGKNRDRWKSVVAAL